MMVTTKDMEGGLIKALVRSKQETEQAHRENDRLQRCINALIAANKEMQQIITADRKCNIILLQKQCMN